MKMCVWIGKFLCILNLVLWSSLSTVQAHSDLLLATPAPGEQLSVIPTEIRLEFSLTLRPESRFFLADSKFQFISDIRSSIRGDGNNVLIAKIPDIPPDVYTVHWLSVSEDGDSLRGSFSFSVQPNAKSSSNAIVRTWQQNRLFSILLLCLLVLGCGWFYRFYRAKRRM